jgi:hypothetical protein
MANNFGPAGASGGDADLAALGKNMNVTRIKTTNAQLRLMVFS